MIMTAVRTLTVGLIAAAIAALAYRPFVSPASSTPRLSPSLASGRVVMLLPDAQVEITDAWARRVYRWDGHRWVKVLSIERPVAPDASRRSQDGE